jgi:cyanophycinase
MVPKGKLIIIGGAEDKGNDPKEIASKNSEFENLEILKELVNLANGSIEIITTATKIPDEIQ